ncbi:MAG: ABC transporter substrate-binding protein [Chromatiales bacterium]|jgi:NitT/TauT family transport system substrate-binding protein|nr:ABC transporter substrate-binding protein [Chromatiales bacterium]
MSSTLRLYENLRAVSYVPFYLADELGLFDEFGVDVSMVLSESPSETAIGLMEGRADVAFGGPMRVMMHHDQDSNCSLVCFCQVVGPEPFSLIGREPNPAFRFADLLDRRIGIVTEVPTPWLLLQDDLRRDGIDPASISRPAPRSMAQNVSALHAGDVDVIQVMEPYTELALQAGHLWHAFAKRGSVGFTTFYTTREFLSSNMAACRSLAGALKASIAKMYALEGGEVANIVAARFPDLSESALANAINRYRANAIWPIDQTLRPSEFVRLKAALLAGDFISADVPFDSAVDNRMLSD